MLWWASLIFIRFPLALEPRTLTRWDVHKYARQAYDLGVRYIGGCCGFEPYHIRAIAEEVGSFKVIYVYLVSRSFSLAWLFVVRECLKPCRKETSVKKNYVQSLPSYGRQTFRWWSVVRGLAVLPLRARVYIYIWGSGGKGSPAKRYTHHCNTSLCTFPVIWRPGTGCLYTSCYNQLQTCWDTPTKKRPFLLQIATGHRSVRYNADLPPPSRWKLFVYRGWRRHHKHKIMDRPFMPKYGTVSQVLLQLVVAFTWALHKLFSNNF